MEVKRFQTLRERLATTLYYRLEDFAHQGVRVHDISVDTRLETAFEFDFYEFERKAMTRLAKSEEWSAEFIVEVIYASMAEVAMKAEIGEMRYYGSMSIPVAPAERKRFSYVFPNGKSILVRREAKAIIATRSNRIPLAGEKKGKSGYAKEFDNLVRNFELERIHEFYAVHDELQSLYPSQYFSVGFNELVENTTVTMRRVSDFLGIEFEESLLRPTWQGLSLDAGEKSLVGTEHDTWQTLLSAGQKRVLERREKFAIVYRNLFSFRQRLLGVLRYTARLLKA